MASKKYDEMSRDEIQAQGVESGIVLDECGLLTDSSKILKMSSDEFELYEALRHEHELYEIQTISTPELKIIRQISCDVALSAFGCVIRYELKSKQGASPNARKLGLIQPFDSIADYEFTKFLMSNVYPLRGEKNVLFRKYVTRIRNSLQLCVDTDWNPEIGSGTYYCAQGKVHATPENLDACKVVWRKNLTQLAELSERVVGDVVTPTEPTMSYLGEFEVDGPLLATDPGYEKKCIEEKLSAQLDAQPGTWEASVCNGIEPGENSWGYRTMHLRVSLKGFKTDPPSWRMHDSIISVDSGTAGFHCLSVYPDSREDNGIFCSLAHDSTRKDYQAGIHQNGKGVTSSAGYGDGGYPLFYMENSEGKVCAAKIVYIVDNWYGPDPEEESPDLAS